MTALPLDVLHKIMEQVPDGRSGRATLVTVSLVNRQCYSLAIPHLYTKLDGNDMCNKKLLSTFESTNLGLKVKSISGLFNVRSATGKRDMPHIVLTALSVLQFCCNLHQLAILYTKELSLKGRSENDATVSLIKSAIHRLPNYRSLMYLELKSSVARQPDDDFFSWMLKLFIPKCLSIHRLSIFGSNTVEWLQNRRLSQLTHLDISLSFPQRDFSRVLSSSNLPKLVDLTCKPGDFQSLCDSPETWDVLGMLERLRCNTTHPQHINNDEKCYKHLQAIRKLHITGRGLLLDHIGALAMSPGSKTLERFNVHGIACTPKSEDLLGVMAILAMHETYPMLTSIYLRYIGSPHSTALPADDDPVQQKLLVRCGFTCPFLSSQTRGILDAYLELSDQAIRPVVTAKIECQQWGIYLGLQLTSNGNSLLLRNHATGEEFCGPISRALHG